MLLRPRQKQLVDRVLEALHSHGNTLAVAPTGAGKTVMLSAAVGALCSPYPLKACVIAHRDELTVQNQAKFSQVNPHLSTSLFDASTKSWQGDTTFAMVQTLSRQNNLDTMPSLDLLVIDEAHHARADTYTRIVHHAQKLNPNLKLLGMTATPNRGDKKGLRPLFSNVCDQIRLRELIVSGHLVKPRTFVMDVGVRKQLQEARKTAGGDYDMDDVAEIMDTRPINSAIVAHWKEKAENRQTVVFCSTVNHARHVCQTFLEQDVAAVLVHGEMLDSERTAALEAYTTGQARVIVNVAVLTEGWDHPPTSCVVLLRPSSYKSTFIQMVGRGLRPISQELYPGVLKTDCIILDFGTATLAHGSLEQEIDLDGEGVPEGEVMTKTCPECKGVLPARVMECSLCGYVFPSSVHETTVPLDVEDFVMREVDLFKDSHFQWSSVQEGEDSYMASGFKAWSTIVSQNGQWHALGGLHGDKVTLLAVGDKTTCVAAANDWMNLKETDTTAHKARGWLTLPPTEKQLGYLPEYQEDTPLTRYQASLLITRKFNEKNVQAALRQGGKHD